VAGSPRERGSKGGRDRGGQGEACNGEVDKETGSGRGSCCRVGPYQQRLATSGCHFSPPFHLSPRFVSYDKRRAQRNSIVLEQVCWRRYRLITGNQRNATVLLQNSGGGGGGSSSSSRFCTR
jgi:hypothetical protein